MFAINFILPNFFVIELGCFGMAQHLNFVIWKWPIDNFLETFPYYLFQSNSLPYFLRSYASELIPLLLVKSIVSQKDAEIVFNWFDDIDFSNVITSFLAMFLSWCFGQGNFLIQGVLFTCVLFL